MVKTGNVAELKCWPDHFQAVKHPDRDQRKTLEIRKEDDALFEVGDVLFLREYDPAADEYTGNVTLALVTHVLRGAPWVSEGYAALSIRLMGASD